MHPKDISIIDFQYQLPAEKIAALPLQQRDASKLLLYKNGDIKESVYSDIAQHIPENSLLVFNNTKVIPARILFKKDAGGSVEIFCLEPFEDQKEYSAVMAKKGSVKWKCMIGGAGKLKTKFFQKVIPAEENDIANESISFCATLIEKLSTAYIVEFSWQPATYTFAEALGIFGDVPLPPYIKRKAVQTDKERYQTIYAAHEGSVAAPTAGLHFTEHVFAALDKKNIQQAFVTLHVGAGTFKPVKAASMKGHEMHAEWIDVDIDTIAKLSANLHNCIVAVGTTSTRTIESLYWMGVKAILFPESSLDELVIHQWDVYEPSLSRSNFSAKDALTALQNWLIKNNCHKIFTITQILIAPSYRYRIIKALITNFHQPQSTLLLLVAAAVGENWRKIYQHAMENDFRFLSYGDGSLLFIDEIL